MVLTEMLDAKEEGWMKSYATHKNVHDGASSLTSLSAVDHVVVVSVHTPDYVFLVAQVTLDAKDLKLKNLFATLM